MLPGSSLVPTARNQRGPYRAIRARWASVSAFCTRVGAPPRPRSLTRGGWNVGSAGPPPSRFTTAASWPARNRGGAWVIVTPSRSRPREDRSASARRICGPGASCRYRCASVAPTASAASCRPSSTRLGASRSSISSLRLAGSLSAPLATATLRPWRGPARATRASFRYTGKAAPPRPVRPDASMSAMSRFACPRYGTGPYLARWARRSSGAAGSSRAGAAGPAAAGRFTAVVIAPPSGGPAWPLRRCAGRRSRPRARPWAPAGRRAPAARLPPPR